MALTVGVVIAIVISVLVVIILIYRYTTLFQYLRGFMYLRFNDSNGNSKSSKQYGKTGARVPRVPASYL